jgi:chromosomal replication initiator protein
MAKRLEGHDHDRGVTSQDSPAAAIPPEHAATPLQDPPESELARRWQGVCARARAEIGDAQLFEAWFRDVTLIAVGDGRAILAAPNRFIRDWLVNHYLDTLRKACVAEMPEVTRIEVRVSEAPHPRAVQRAARAATTTSSRAKPLINGAAQGAGHAAEPSASATRAPAEQSGAATPGDALLARLNPHYTFDNFVVGRSNQFAYAAARRVAEAASVPFNPLFLHSPVGLGKTHLMHAVAQEIHARHPDRKVLYLSAEKFMYRFIQAMRDKDTMAFKQEFRSVDVLMIDDVHVFIGKETTQDEFFHTFNELVSQGRQVVISADRSPSDLSDLDERLRSRLGWGLVADIDATDYELRLGILHSKLKHMREAGHGIDVPPPVLEMLAQRIVSNIRELEGALNRVVAYAELTGRPLTLETAHTVLSDVLRRFDRAVTIEEIQKKVAEYCNVRFGDMVSARRHKPFVRARQLAMYLCKILTQHSYPMIGRKFGGRDHTTVMHAVRKIEELATTDTTLAEDIEMLRRMLEN